MILREIEMNLPYIVGENQEIMSNEDIRRDYELNWHEKSWNFQLMTRCMTSMIERIMPRIVTKDYWKILIECVEVPTREKGINLGGVYCVQVPFDINAFFEMDDLEKKACVICKIREAIGLIAQNDLFNKEAIEWACNEVICAGYVNEWLWKKPVRNKRLSAQIKVSHDVERVNLYMTFNDTIKHVSKSVFLVSAIPDERTYAQYLGKVEWVSENKVRLLTKEGESFFASYE